MKQGDRVRIHTGETGTVNYVRVRGAEVEAVSVLRDSQADRPGYKGSIYSPEQVETTNRPHGEVAALPSHHGGASCDWGGCARTARRWRFDGDGMGWLPVCGEHAESPVSRLVLVGAEGVAEVEGQRWVRPADHKLERFLRDKEISRARFDEVARDATGRPYWLMEVLPDAPEEAYRRADGIRVVRLVG